MFEKRKRRTKVLKPNLRILSEGRVIPMFNGEKTNLFWAGLLLLGLASLVLFTAIWQLIINYMNYLSYSRNYPTSFYGWSSVPIIVGGIIFMLIGLYMMKSGVKKEQPNSPNQLRIS